MAGVYTEETLRALNKNQIIDLFLKHPKIKLQRFRKIRIWTFGSLLHQIDSFQEVLKLK